MQWVYRISDSVFLREKGSEALATGEALADVDQFPNISAERYDAVSRTKRRPATADEQTASTAARVNDAALGESQRRVVRALVLFYLRDKLGRDPTAPERQAARDAFIQAFKDVG